MYIYIYMRVLINIFMKVLSSEICIYVLVRAVMFFSVAPNHVLIRQSAHIRMYRIFVKRASALNSNDLSQLNMASEAQRPFYIFSTLAVVFRDGARSARLQH